GVGVSATIEPVIAGATIQCVVAPARDRFVTEQFIVSGPADQHVVSPLTPKRYRIAHSGRIEDIVARAAVSELDLGARQLEVEPSRRPLGVVGVEAVIAVTTVHEGVVVVDEERIVAGAAGQLIGTRATLDDVVTGPTDEPIVAAKPIGGLPAVSVA